jgi:hypothetical protein
MAGTSQVETRKAVQINDISTKEFGCHVQSLATRTEWEEWSLSTLPGRFAY